METKQIIIYAIVAFAVYKLFIEKEGFAFRTTDSTLNTSNYCLLYTSPSPRDRQKSRMPSSA